MSDPSQEGKNNTNQKNELFFRLDAKEEALKLVKRFHYSHREPSVVQVVGTFHGTGGLFGDYGTAVAACIFSLPPTRWSEEVLELIRLVRRDDTNVELSKLISLTCKECKRKRFDLLVSYADYTEKHHGGIYQACSWFYHGFRDSRKTALLIGGVRVPCRTSNGLHGTDSVKKLATKGIVATEIFDDGKHLYWKPLNRNGERKAERLRLQKNAYPKPTPFLASERKRKPVFIASRPMQENQQP